MLKKNWVLSLIILALLVHLTGCTCNKETTETPVPKENARLEVTYEPNPGSYRDEEGFWSWKIVLSESNGIGVNLTNFNRKYTMGGSSYDSSKIEEICSTNYVPPWGTLYLSYWFDYIPPFVNYEIDTFSGIDDKGSEVSAEGELTILSQEEKAAQAILKFNPNPVEEQSGTWKILLSEHNGFGVELSSLIRCTYDRNSKLVNIEKSDTSLIEEYFGSAYLPPYGSLTSRELSSPRQEISYETITINGLDDEDHLITVSGKIYYGETAKAEIVFNPNPVSCKNERWFWETTLNENNGVGIKITGSAREDFGDRGIAIHNYEDSAIEEWYGSAYIPPYGSLSWHDSSTYRPGANYRKLIFTGIDDNGHKITIEGKVELLPP